MASPSIKRLHMVVQGEDDKSSCYFMCIDTDRFCTFKKKLKASTEHKLTSCTFCPPDGSAVWEQRCSKMAKSKQLGNFFHFPYRSQLVAAARHSWKTTGRCEVHLPCNTEFGPNRHKNGSMKKNWRSRRNLPLIGLSICLLISFYFSLPSFIASVTAMLLIPFN